MTAAAKPSARFAGFTQDEKDSLVLALGEYLQGRYGDSGAYLDDALSEPYPDARLPLFVAALRAGGHPDPYMRELAQRARRLFPKE